MPNSRVPLVLLSCFLAACSGVHSTVKDGYAYRMTESQARGVIDSAIRSNIVSDRMLPGGALTASGYDRSLTDTQTYTATAIPVTAVLGFGFELHHEGTMFNGPSKARRIFDQINQRASLVGNRVSINR